MTQEEKTLSYGNPTIQLSQGDVAKAVEYWLNHEVMKIPVTVKYLSKQTGVGQYGFSVVFEETDSIESAKD